MPTRLDDLLEPEVADDDLPDDDLPDDDDLLADDDALRPPPRTSRLTLALVALLVLLVGFFLGVQVERVAGGSPPAASRTATSPSTSAG